jgi:hypothetical protein
MRKGTWLRALLAMVIGGATIMVAATPASATVPVPHGQSGHACSAYKDITANVFWQACAWASTGPSPRVWFTAHFGNRGAVAFSVDEVHLGFTWNRVLLDCFVQRGLVVPARGYAATVDTCWMSRPRQGGAFAASIAVYDGGYAARQSSPTLQVRP